MLELAKNKFDYNEISIKQIEEKSRSFTLLITTVTGFLTLIYKQENIVKKLSGEIFSNTFALLLLVDLILIISSVFLSYYLTYMALKPTEYVAIGEPKSIQESIINHSDSDFQTVISIINAYTKCSLQTDKIITDKSNYMKQQSVLTLYFVLLCITFIVLGGINYG